MLKQVFVLLFLVSVALAQSYYVIFKDSYLGKESPDFVVELTRIEDIVHATELLKGETTDRPHIKGKIVKTTANYNKNYPYHLDPETIEFFNNKTESCETSFSEVGSFLDEACSNSFLPECILCSSESKIFKL